MTRLPRGVVFRPSAPKPAKQIVVRETEFKVDPAQAAGGDVGLVSIKIVNDGRVAHALAVDGPNGEIQLDGRVAPGATATLEADLDKPGPYTMYCPLDGHRAKGMVGSITVGGDRPARGRSPAPPPRRRRPPGRRPRRKRKRKPRRRP